MPKLRNLSNKTFNSIYCIEQTTKRSNKSVIWRCVCGRCGNFFEARSNNILSGHTKSCGCLQKDKSIKRISKVNKTHGKSKTKTYISWRRMKDRCYNKNHIYYNHYGGRGIVVCKEWIDNFESFLKDMGERPKNTVINRINNNGNYEPKNCEWTTQDKNLKNRRKWKKK